MKDLLSRIFEDIISNDSDVVKMNCKLDDEIKNIICAHGKDADALSEDELDAFSDVAYLAQRQGFIVGVRYAVKLFMGAMSD